MLILQIYVISNHQGEGPSLTQKLLCEIQNKSKKI